MIKYALVCDNGHEFESWFSNSDAFDTQAKRGFVDCPQCGSLKVSKALMTPSVATSRKREARAEAARAPQDAPETGGMTLLDEKQIKLREMLRELHAKIVETTDDVGARLPEEARKIRDGDAPARSIRGEATLEEARDLWEEGIPVLPIPTLPDERN